MGQAVGCSTQVNDWVFPVVPPSYDEAHPLLVYFDGPCVDTKAAGLFLGKDLVPAEDCRKLGSIVSTCLIYFHANGCDAGQCIEDMITFRDGLLDGDAVVLTPEYPGYGVLSEYEPSVASITLVADCAWRHCVVGMGFRPSQVMVVGRSIGTGPATELAYSVAARARAAVEGDGMGCGDGLAKASGLDEARAENDGAASGASSSRGPRSRPPKRPPRVGPPAERGVGALPGAFLGADVVVLRDFRSASTGSRLIQAGEKGHVVKVDDAGDLLVDFEGHSRSQWVHQSHAATCLRFEERPVGALVLIAPLVSVAAVVQHHVASEFAASLVGDMWNVLSRIHDPACARTPLLIIHPQNDEIVPGNHGQQLFDNASTKRKFGIWLRNAVHNVALEEEHLEIARSFMHNAVMPCRAAVPCAPALGEVSDAPDGDNGDVGDDELARIADQLIHLASSGQAEQLVIMSL